MPHWPWMLPTTHQVGALNNSLITQKSSVGIAPADLALPEAYQLLLGCVAPRPIAFVSSISPDGKPNLAPFSFFMAGGANPPTVAFAPVNDRNGSPKDTLRNVQATGEFVINVVTYAIREPMNQASAEYPYGISEWEQAGFTPVPSLHVRPARVRESPIAMECRLYQLVPHGEGGLAGTYIIGEVLYFHVAQELMDGGRIDPTKVDYIGRMAGAWYARAHPPAMFELPRPPRPNL